MIQAIHKDIRVMGKVQGVGFRMSARQKAQELGVRGFVKNEPDGTVFIETEGSKQALEKFTTWCKDGPALATVREVTVQEGKIKGYNEFKIHYS